MSKQKLKKVEILQRWIDHRADGVSISYWPGECELAPDVADDLVRRGIAKLKRQKRRHSGGATSKKEK